jgi:tyrosyl-tRNA synthetase
MQAYDSVEVKADIELGGTDQTFNLMVGRDLMRDMGMDPQCAMTMPLLVGTDGKEKMSKSYGNHVGISMEAFEMYSRILSLPDDLMKDYYTLLTLLPGDEIDRLCDGEKTHPKAAKDRLAREVAAAYYPREEVDIAANRWEEKFSQKKVTDVKELTLEERPVALIPLLRATEIPKSNGEARRLIEQGGVEIDGLRMVDPKAELDLKAGAILRVGKKRQFFRVTWS